MKPRHNILIDHGGYANLGDAAMLEGVATKLRAVLPQSQFFVVDHEVVPTSLMQQPWVQSIKLRIPEPTLQHKRFLWRFEARAGGLYRRFEMSRIGRTAERLKIDIHGEPTLLGEFCKGFDSLHVVGGGNLTDIFPIELWNRCCLISAFASQGKPVVLTGQQIGPFRAQAARVTVQSAMRKATFVGLREPGNSFDFCEEAKLSENNYAVTGDDSFGVDRADDATALKLLSTLGLERGQYLAVNLRLASYAREHETHFDWFVRMVEMVSQRLGIPVLVVPISLGAGDSDERTGKHLIERLTNVNRPVNVNWSIQIAKSLLAMAHSAVGASYHFCTFALSEGTPAICVHDGAYYGQKAAGIASLWKDDRLAIQLGALSVQDAADNICDVVTNPTVRRAIVEQTSVLKDRWDSFFNDTVPRLYGFTGTGRRAM